jgi:glutamate dehydrogenase
VLGLVQTQVVKNAVIVPGGSKGGFVTRLQSDSRDAIMADAADQYRTLIRGMLDITDNIVDGQVVPPPDVVRHDDDDPYLVVAADKGTAHLSDTANEVAARVRLLAGRRLRVRRILRLRPQEGRDHRARRLGMRQAPLLGAGQGHPGRAVHVAGIGDMSGDVFGNGMLLSRQIRLVAAFDHRHIFIDPDPTRRPRTSSGSASSLCAAPPGTITTARSCHPAA